MTSPRRAADRSPLLATTLRLLDHRGFLPAVLTLAILLRLVAVFGVGTDVLYSDGADYHALAQRLLATGAYANADGSLHAYRPVGYPAFLAALYGIFGTHVLLAQLANVAIQASSIALLWDLTRKTFATERQARMAALLMCCHPNAVLYTSIVQTESLALGLTALAAWSFVRCRWVLAGVAWGLLVLVKPPYLLLFPLLLRWTNTTLRRTVSGVLIAGVVGCLIVGPWIVRNSIEARHLSFVASNAGVNLRIGHNPSADGTYDAPPLLMDELHETRHLSEWEQSDVMSERAVEWLRQNPTTEASLIARRFVYLWVHDADAVRSLQVIRGNGTAPLASIVYWPLLVVSLLFYAGVMLCIGVAVIRSPRLLTSLPVRVAVVISLVHMAFFGSARFHFVPFTLLICLAPLVVGHVRKPLQRRSPTS